MNNITGIGVIQLGNAKRIGITYQVVDESGKITAYRDGETDRKSGV